MTKLSQTLSKMLNMEQLNVALENWKAEGKKVVFTNGCFDILHKGHVDYLAKAAELGDILLVGINTDESVSKLKGPHRPIQDENSRMQIIASLGFVNGVVLFGEPTPLSLIKLVQPDVLVKGSDYLPENIVGYDIVKAKGGNIQTIDFLPGYSTSAIEQKIKSS